MDSEWTKTCKQRNGTLKKTWSTEVREIQKKSNMEWVSAKKLAKNKRNQFRRK